MNIFRMLGDFLHIGSILILLWRLLTRKNCAGVSLKTQELMLLVFVTRYMDLFWTSSWYNFLMKILYLATTGYTVFVMRTLLSPTLDKRDTFRSQFLIGGAAVAGILFTKNYSPTEILWSFSIVLESMAIFPQLVLLQRTKDVENLTADYIACLGGYRLFYLINWIYRYFTQKHYWQPLKWIFGLLQTGLYADFFYYYYHSRMQGQSMSLPH